MGFHTSSPFGGDETQESIQVDSPVPKTKVAVEPEKRPPLEKEEQLEMKV